MSWFGLYEMQRHVDAELRVEHGVGYDQDQPRDLWPLIDSPSLVARCLVVDMQRAPWARDAARERREREEMEGRD